jgi:hypothetical protein
MFSFNLFSRKAGMQIDLLVQKHSTCTIIPNDIVPVVSVSFAIVPSLDMAPLPTLCGCAAPFVVDKTELPWFCTDFGKLSLDFDSDNHRASSDDAQKSPATVHFLLPTYTKSAPATIRPLLQNGPKKHALQTICDVHYNSSIRVLHI